MDGALPEEPRAGLLSSVLHQLDEADAMGVGAQAPPPAGGSLPSATTPSPVSR